MIAVDTNVLIFAHRAETALHARSFALLRDLAEGSALWGLPVFCLAEFVRVVTHLRVFTPPTHAGVALDFIDGLLAAPTVRLLLPTVEFPSLFRERVQTAGARGNLAFDAQIAAVCLEHGVSELITADRDFARFSDLKVRLLAS